MRRTTPDIHLDLTPLIDVVFLLLIFFMLSANFDELQWLDVQLPSIDQTQTMEIETKPYVIGIDATGALHINEENIGNLSSEELKKYLTQHLPKDPIVVIHGDAKAPHERLVQLLEVLGQLKISQLHIAAISD
ncbi:MAG: biopolymer transporter ExbD [Legionellales bacterium]|jgi:biopolymer transport protein ExbD